MTKKLPKVWKFILGLSILVFVATNYYAIENETLFFLIPLVILIIGIVLLIGRSKSLKYYYIISSSLLLTLFIFVFFVWKKSDLEPLILAFSLATLMHMILSFCAIKFSFENDNKIKKILYFGMSLVFLATPLIQIIADSEYSLIWPCLLVGGLVLAEGLVMILNKNRKKYLVTHLLSTGYFFLIYWLLVRLILIMQ